MASEGEWGQKEMLGGHVIGVRRIDNEDDDEDEEGIFDFGRRTRNA
jgi:hypothetical protein